MKSRFVTIMGRVVLAIIVVAGSIVTFNFGLEGGLNPASGIRREPFICDFSDICDKGDITPVTGNGGPNQSLALLLLAVAAFMLSQSIMSRNSGSRRTKNTDAALSYPWATPAPQWITSVSTRQLGRARIKRRPYKRVSAS